MSKPTAVKKGNAYAAPTDAQLRFARSLAIKAGYPVAYAVDAARRDMNGKNRVGSMGRQECSDLIEWLQSR
jgi:hypothetical protein